MSEIKWVKLDTGLPDNRKIKQIRRLPNGDTMALAWVFLVCLAGDINDGGQIYLTDGVPYTDEMLAEQFGMDVSTIRMALEVFQRFHMADIKEDGVICLTSWEEHQSVDRMAEIREQTRKRVAKCREKKRLEQCNVTGNATEALSNAIEKDKEGNKEKESHSFTQSAEGDQFSTGVFAREEAKRSLLYGDLGQGVVLLSEEQMNDLLDKLSIDEFNHYVSVVAKAELAGKHYKKKTHYQAILDMASKDRGVKR